MLYINQLNYPFYAYKTRTDTPEDDHGRNTTISTSGCGLCCAVMVADRLLTDPNFGLHEAIGLAYTTGSNHIVGTDYDIYAPALAEKLGLYYEPANSLDSLTACLQTGGVAVADVGEPADKRYKAVFTHGGHYILVVSQERDGRFCILDPALKPEKFNEPARIGKVETKGDFCYTSGEVLMRDTDMNAPKRFHLFWRP